MLRVIAPFADAADGLHNYRAGDTYPRAGLQPDAARVAALASGNNPRGRPLIERVPDAPAAEPPAPRKRKAKNHA